MRIIKAVMASILVVVTVYTQHVELVDSVIGKKTTNMGKIDVFNSEELSTFNLTIDDEYFRYLRADITREKYVPALLVVNGDSIGIVGIRYKGSTFTLKGCVSESDSITCNKISMKIKFDKYDKFLRFQGMKRLNFNSMMYDASALNERIAYSIYREMGIVAPRAAHAKLVINNEYMGLFSLVEQIDDVFIKKHFPVASSGNLFKERWPVTNDSTYYMRGLKTNNGTANPSAFLNLYKALEEASDSNLTKVIERFTKVDYLLRYMAVDRAIANWDGVTAFYYSKTLNNYLNHNYYWYQEPGRDYFWLIPWDLDGTMNINTGFDHVPAWNESVDNLNAEYSIFDGESKAVAPYVDRFMRGWGMIANENNKFRLYQEKILDGPFREGYLEAKIDIWAKQLEKAIELDDYGPPIHIWLNEVAKVRNSISLLRERLMKEMNDEKLNPYLFSYRENNSFEGICAYDLHSGLDIASNRESSVRLSLNEKCVLSGKRDIRLDFKMFNETDDPEKGAFSQWVWLEGFWDKTKSIVDFEAEKISGIEFTASSDKNRNLWIGIGSRALGDDECYLGWDVNIGKRKRRYKVYLKDGTFPFWMKKPKHYKMSSILQQVMSLAISPDAEGRRKDGIYKEGNYDSGYLQIDDIKFISEKK